MSAARDRLAASYYNSQPVSVDNPGGMDDDGHVTNFPAALVDVGVVAGEVAASAEAADTAKGQAQAAATAADNSLAALNLGAGAITDAAAASATAAAGSAAGAQRTVANNFPDRLDETGSWFSEAAIGDPGVIASPATAPVMVAGYGYEYAKANAQGQLFTKGALSASQGKVYEIEAEIHQVVKGGAETPAAAIGLQGLDDAFASTGAQVKSPLVATPVGVTVIKYRFAYAAPAGGAAWPQPGTSIWLRPFVVFNRKSDDSGAVTASTARVRRLTVRDVTAVVAAEAAQAAAAASAGTLTYATQAEALAKVPDRITAPREVAKMIDVLSSLPAGMRAQFDVPPPAPWLPLTGGTALIASYPQIAVPLNIPTASGVVSAEATIDDVARFPFPGGGGNQWTPFAFTKGAGYYWAIFVKSAGASWSIACFRSLNPLTGYSWVFTETNVAPGAAGSGYDPTYGQDRLDSRGVVWGNNQGLFSLGNTLLILDVAGCVRRDDVFGSGWDVTRSKIFAYGAGKWVAMDPGQVTYSSATVGSSGYGAKVTTCVDPKGAWTDRGYAGPPAANLAAQYLTITRLVFAFGKFHALNSQTGYSGPSVVASADGYTNWAAAPGSPGANYNWRDLVFDGTALWVTNSYNGAVQRVTLRTLDGAAWVAVTDPSNLPNGNVLPFQTGGWSGGLTFIYDSSAGVYSSRLLTSVSTVSLAMATANAMASATANSTAKIVYDDALGRFIALSSYSSALTLTMAVNPATTFVLPNAGTTPPTYIYGK